VNRKSSQDIYCANTSYSTCSFQIAWQLPLPSAPGMVPTGPPEPELLRAAEWSPQKEAIDSIPVDDSTAAGETRRGNPRPAGSPRRCWLPLVAARGRASTVGSWVNNECVHGGRLRCFRLAGRPALAVRQQRW
jgi:hypothetical protein